MQLPQVNSAAALATAHLPMVRRALVASDEIHSVGFVFDSSDELARELMSSYAPQPKRFGNQWIDSVHVFALAFDDAMTLLRAPEHAGERETQTAIIGALCRWPATFSCVCFAFGAVVLIEASGAATPPSNSN